MELVYKSEGQGRPSIWTNFDKSIPRYKKHLEAQKKLVDANALPDEPLSPEDHALVLETGILNSLKAATRHEITMNILSLKPNTMYLARYFGGKGDWVTHYTAILTRLDKLMK